MNIICCPAAINRIVTDIDGDKARLSCDSCHGSIPISYCPFCGQCLGARCPEVANGEYCSRPYGHVGQCL